jgi:hypothetical protein
MVLLSDGRRTGPDFCRKGIIFAGPFSKLLYKGEANAASSERRIFRAL